MIEKTLKPNYKSKVSSVWVIEYNRNNRKALKEDIYTVVYI